MRWFVALAVGAWLVHELRYLLAFAPRHEEAMAAQGHAYLQSLTPLLVLALVATAAWGVVRVTRPAAAATHVGPGPLSSTRRGRRRRRR